MDDVEFPQRILGDVVWFARQPIAAARKYLDEPSLAEYIERTRMAPLSGKEDDVNTVVAYPLNEVLALGWNYIMLSFQIDRYSKLKPRLLKFQCKPARVTIKCESMQEFERKRNELRTSHSCIAYSEQNLELSYIDDNAKSCTTGELLEHIYRFYSADMTNDELSAVSQTDDGWGYSQRAAQAINDGTVLYREEVMGDCMHFEGLRLIGHAMGKEGKYPVYAVDFGS